MARTVRIDDWTLSVVQAMRAASVGPLLLKGPAVTDWLYGGDRTLRPYRDADLLVSGAALPSARDVLRSLGFVCPCSFEDAQLSGNRSRHAEVWLRLSDHAVVDLHRSLHGTDHLPDDVLWDVLSRNPESVELYGDDVAVPSQAVRTLHTVLHMQPDEPAAGQVARDLERAIAVLPGDVWVGAKAVATELGIVDEMGYRVRLVPTGVALADALVLPAAMPAYLRLWWDDATPPVRVFVEQMRQVDLGTRFVLLARKVFPAADYVRRGWPFARRGRWQLVAVYVWRLGLVPARGAQLLRFEAMKRLSVIRDPLRG